VDVDESGGLEPSGRLLGAGEVTNALPGFAERCERRLDGRDVAAATALCGEAATGLEHGGEMAEQRVVVEDPVERGRREDGVDRRAHRQRRGEVGKDELDAVAVCLEAPACFVEHRRRRVERHDVAVQELVEELLRDPPGTAAGVQHSLVAAERQAGQNGGSPASLGGGNAVVRGGIPFGGHGHSVPTGVADACARVRRSGATDCRL
jgi:hypothetical protein